MKKLLIIGWKDLLLSLRDPGALILTLITPFALTLVMGFAFGGFGGGGTVGGLRDIPVAVVNQDQGEFGGYLVDLFQSQELADLLEPTIMDDPAAARALVDQDKLAAAVIVPANLSDAIVPSVFAGPGGGAYAQLALSSVSPEDLKKLAEPQSASIEVYANPTRSVSVSVVRTVVDRFLSKATAGLAAGRVTFQQLFQDGLVTADLAVTTTQEIGARVAQKAQDAEAVAVVTETTAEEPQGQGFDWLAYMAPSMAVLFLMFTVTIGGRSILAERDGGTLPRMLTTPTRAVQVIGGKMLGVYLTGVVQLVTLLVATTFLLGVNWGQTVGVAALILSVVAAATSWGMVIAAFSRTPGQANAIGTAITLVFAATAGNFVPRFLLPDWLQKLSYVSPNAWALEGFTQLAGNASLPEIWAPIVGLWAMFALLFAVSVIGFRRQYA